PGDGLDRLAQPASFRRRVDARPAASVDAKRRRPRQHPARRQPCDALPLPRDGAGDGPVDLPPRGAGGDPEWGVVLVQRGGTPAWHLVVGQDGADDALVAVPVRELVADVQRQRPTYPHPIDCTPGAGQLAAEANPLVLLDGHDDSADAGAVLRLGPD